MLEGKSWITHYGGQQTILFSNEETEQLKQEEEAMTEHILSNIIGTSLKSPQTIINKVYDKIGFNAIQDEELRHLVVSRICSPMSKKATVDCLRRHFKEDVRPMFHFTPRRIEALVCICFVALKVYKELERLLKRSGCPYSVDEVLKLHI